MATAGQALPGGCLCGAVRFTAVPAKPEMDVCHCGMCRRWSGGVFMSVPCHDVVVTPGGALGTYQSSEWAERQFCTACGSSLFWRLREGGGHVAVSMQAFDDPSGFSFEEEIYIDEKPAAYAFAGERRRKTGAEVEAEFAPKQAQ